MKIVQLNSSCDKGSTGTICVEISKLLTEHNIENFILYSNDRSNYQQGIKYANTNEIKLGALESRLFGNWGTENNCSTKRLISILSNIHPDLVHLHNIHSHACNIQMLFDYLSKEKIKVVWTFHDCWSITGYCTHFEMAGCLKWRAGCYNCPLKKHYSWIIDNSFKQYQIKKSLLSNQSFTIITPSKWMSEQVSQSFLKSHPIKVINNGIDLDAFHPISGDFREKNNIRNEKIILGVSSIWNKQKGLDVFISMAEKLPPNYRIVLVGIEKKRDFPPAIIPIGRINNREQLAQLYSAADVFVNPTREDTFPTVNIEALACGTPVISFDSGGSSEIPDSSCGSIVPKNDIESLVKESIRICEEKPFSKEACQNRAACFDQRVRFNDYYLLYMDLLRN